ncbi:MAG TPA: rhomboid family intramembrane serine protease, partial [Gemmatimonadota bacterium]|nr:rhomboid family intramembrane serine protease [Gemmatimonadota bacterium]
MSYAERSYSYDPGRGDFGGRGLGGGGWNLGRFLTPWVTRLLVANGAIWLLNAVGLLPLGWTVDAFGFAPDRFLTHPWTPLTYMFVHGGFLHVFLNMLVLFFFGPPLER